MYIGNTRTYFLETRKNNVGFTGWSNVLTRLWVRQYRQYCLLLNYEKSKGWLTYTYNNYVDENEMKLSYSDQWIDEWNKTAE